MAKTVMWKIDNVSMPPIAADGIKVQRTKLWAENSGRTADGTWVGTVKCLKRTVQITMPPNLSEIERKSVYDAMNNVTNPYHKFQWINEFDEWETIDKCYLNDYEVTTSQLKHGKYVRVKSFECHAIEV